MNLPKIARLTRGQSIAQQKEIKADIIQIGKAKNKKIYSAKISRRSTSINNNIDNKETPNNINIYKRDFIFNKKRFSTPKKSNQQTQYSINIPNSCNKRLLTSQSRLQRSIGYQTQRTLYRKLGTQQSSEITNNSRLKNQRIQRQIKQQKQLAQIMEQTTKDIIQKVNKKKTKKEKCFAKSNQFKKKNQQELKIQQLIEQLVKVKTQNNKLRRQNALINHQRIKQNIIFQQSIDRQKINNQKQKNASRKQINQLKKEIYKLKQQSQKKSKIRVNNQQSKQIFIREKNRQIQVYQQYIIKLEQEKQDLKNQLQIKTKKIEQIIPNKNMNERQNNFIPQAQIRLQDKIDFKDNAPFETSLTHTQIQRNIQSNNLPEQKPIVKYYQIVRRGKTPQ